MASPLLLLGALRRSLGYLLGALIVVLGWSALDLITLLPVWLPMDVVLVSGRAGARWLDLGARWIAEHRRAIESGVAAGFALFLACRGLGDL